MKKNLYYATVYQRQNILKTQILNLFLLFSSYPRVILEVFLRRNMGERYFKLSSAVTAFVVFCAIPFFYGNRRSDGAEIIADNGPYYAFLTLSLFFAAFRYGQIKQAPSVFDFSRFSLSTGQVNPIFDKINLFGKTPSVRTIEIWLEPLPFFLFGLFMTKTDSGSSLGLLLIGCSIFYSLSYSAAYMKGDEFIMDRIDEIICNEELSETFVKDEVSPRGFRWYGKKPSSQDLREDHVEDICFEIVDEEETEAR